MIRCVFWIFYFSSILFLACTSSPAKRGAEAIVDHTLDAYHSKLFDKSTIEFNLGNQLWKSKRLNGKYTYERIFDSTGMTIHDEFANAVMTRFISNRLIPLEGKHLSQLIDEINTEMHFFSTPFGLDDSSVIRQYIGEVTILGKKYDKIKIDFKPAPGDFLYHDDHYVYWVNKENHLIDYIGYDFTRNDQSHTLFRKSINQRKINGLTVQDYVMYKPLHDSIPSKLESLDEAFSGNQLQETGRIVYQNVKVNYN